MPANRPQGTLSDSEGANPNLSTRVYDRPTAPPRPVGMGKNAQMGAAASSGRRRRRWMVLGAVFAVVIAVGVAGGYGMRGGRGKPSAVASSGTNGSATQPSSSERPTTKSSGSATPSATTTPSAP